jgi:adenine specific DNA methylase Mod
MAKAVVNLGTEETIRTLSKEELNELVVLLTHVNISTGSNSSLIKDEIVKAKNFIEEQWI